MIRICSSGNDLNLTTGAGTTVSGYTRGIRARNNGSGATTVIANGNVTGTNNEGIYARNSSSATDISVTTGADSTVTGGNRGIRARHYGSGTVNVTANGNVEGTTDEGIYARNRNAPISA